MSGLVGVQNLVAPCASFIAHVGIIGAFEAAIAADVRELYEMRADRLVAVDACSERSPLRCEVAFVFDHSLTSVRSRAVDPFALRFVHVYIVACCGMASTLHSVVMMCASCSGNVRG